MFVVNTTVQLPRGSMLINVESKCEQLNEQDRVCDFDIGDTLRSWYVSDDASGYRATPELLVLGMWLFLTDLVKQDESAVGRDLVISNVTMNAPGQQISFAL